jgi:hypothetical protein
MAASCVEPIDEAEFLGLANGTCNCPLSGAEQSMTWRLRQVKNSPKPVIKPERERRRLPDLGGNRG